MNYSLPKTVEICGAEYKIRSDFRVILDICAALNDVELSDNERGDVVLNIFYEDFSDIPPENYDEAIKMCFWFIGCGENDDGKPRPKLMDWERDFQHIISPVNRTLGFEARALKYLHWWTFVGAYKEIGDCFFTQIVNIRSKRAKGKPLDKTEQEFYRHNRDVIDLKTPYTEADDAAVSKWLGK